MILMSNTTELYNETSIAILYHIDRIADTYKTLLLDKNVGF